MEEIDTMGMAEKIKERRNIMGLTQEQLGAKIGLQKSAIAKYENGRVENIKRSVIIAMAKVLECSPCYLMDWEEERTKVISSKIIDFYEMLNDIGKCEAIKRVEELTCIPKYTIQDYTNIINKQWDEEVSNKNGVSEHILFKDIQSAKKFLEKKQSIAAFEGINGLDEEVIIAMANIISKNHK